jgi:hypothetical protein
MCNKKPLSHDAALVHPKPSLSKYKEAVETQMKPIGVHLTGSVVKTMMRWSFCHCESLRDATKSSLSSHAPILPELIPTMHRLDYSPFQHLQILLFVLKGLCSNEQ